ncbi:MAG: PEP-CTERM sorting domain-containing protein [Candidatus Acidiferrales bacterium]
MLKKFAIASFFALIALAAVAAPANADGLPVVSVTLTGVSGGSANGVDTSPYYGIVGGTAGVAIVCDDYWHDVYIGETWTATVNTFSSLDQARFQGANAAATLLMYEEAAFLVEQLSSHPGAANDISFAIWSIFSAGVPPTANSAWWLSYAASQSYYAGEFANFEILTPTDSSQGSAQEYLVNTPEPASILLLGSGLLALGSWRRRTNRSVQAS